MRRFLSFIILFLFASFLFGAELVFKSNELGMSLERIPKVRERDFSYILLVKTEGKKTTRRLLRDGREIKRWEREEGSGGALSEEYFENGELVQMQRFEAGRLAEESLFASGLLQEKKVLTYTGDTLTASSVYGPGGLLFSDQYVRGGSGSLRRLIRSYPDGKRVVSSFSLAAGKMLEEWHGDANDADLFRFSGGGLLSEETYREGRLAVSKVYTYAEGRAASAEEDYGSGVRTDRVYDEDFRVVSEVTEDPVSGRSETAFTYLGDKLSEKTRRSAGLRERWVYAYGPSGILERELYAKNGVTVKVTTHQGSDSVEELYRDGEPFLRVFFRNKERVGEEFIDAR